MPAIRVRLSLNALRLAARQRLRSAALGTFTGLAFAIGIGVSAVIFSVIDGVLLEPF